MKSIVVTGSAYDRATPMSINVAEFEQPEEGTRGPALGLKQLDVGFWDGCLAPSWAFLDPATLADHHVRACEKWIWMVHPSGYVCSGK